MDIFISMCITGLTNSQLKESSIYLAAKDLKLHFENISEPADPPVTVHIGGCFELDDMKYILPILSGCKIHIADVTRPSIGVGIEMGLSVAKGIPVIPTCDEKMKHEISPFIQASLNRHILFYSDRHDLNRQLKNEISAYLAAYAR